MTNNNFDNEMAKILRDLKIPYDVESWNRLEKKLNENDSEDAIFDQVIAGKLKSFSVPIAANSFDKLEAKLDKSTAKESSDFRLFAGIAAALLLLIFGYYYIENDANKDIVENKNIESIEVGEESGNIAAIEPKTNSYKDNLSIISVSNIDNNPAINRNYSRNIAHKRNKNTSLSSNTKSKYIGDFIVPNTFDARLNPNYGMKYIGDNPYYQSPFSHSQRAYSNLIPNGYTMNFTFTIDFGQESYPISKKEQLYPGNNIHYLPNGEKVESKSFMPNNSIAMSKAKKDDQNSLEVSKSFNSDHMGEEIHDMVLVNNGNVKQISNGFFVKTYVSPTINLIQTPNDKELNTPGYSQTKTGFGGGVSLSYKKNKHEIESGINVASLRYSPKRNVQGNESSSLYLDEIKYLQVKMPLVHKYHLVENSKWDMYTVAGVSANAVYKADYVFVETKVDDRGNEHTLKKYAEELKDDFYFQNTLYGKKFYPKGVHDGAKIKDKLFVSTNVGVGFKRKFKNGLSIYIEPQYNYTFSEFGPNRDLLSCGEFRLGVSKALSL